MPLVISDEYLPATLTAHRMTDEEFAAFCAAHPDLSIEMTADGEIIIMAPTHSLTGIRNSEINRQLGNWAIQDGRGVTGDSSTGFVLPNGARRSPDASWTLNSRSERLYVSGEDGFWHLCPDFVIELQSGSDRPPMLREKMREYMANGAQLGWLIDPQKRSVAIYRPDGEVETRTEINSLAGEGPVAGFVLDLTFIWNPRGR
jgi:Uma2 family endonuclease